MNLEMDKESQEVTKIKLNLNDMKLFIGEYLHYMY